MTAYLELSAEYWAQILEPEDHEHEVGEDRSLCKNCQLDELAEKMSAFETACHNWYFENVTRFAAEAGMVAEIVRSEGFAPTALRMFLKALNMVHVAVNRITREQARAEAEKS